MSRLRQSPIRSRSPSCPFYLAISPILACLFFPLACARSDQWLQCAPESEAALVDVFCRCKADPFEGTRGAVQYVLRLVNSGPSDLDNLRLTINNTWSAELGQLTVYKGFWRGSAAVGEGRLAAGEVIELVFSHDVSNHLLFRNNLGQSMSPATRFETLRLDYAKGSERLKFANWQPEDAALEK